MYVSKDLHICRTAFESSVIFSSAMLYALWELSSVTFIIFFYSKTFHLRKITCGLPICFSVSGRRSICIFPSLKEALGGVGRERVCFSLGSLLVTAVWGVCPSFLPGQPYKQPCVVLAISVSPGRRWKSLGTSAAVRFVAEAFCAESCCQHHDGNWSL